MSLSYSLSAEQIERYARIIREWMAVRRHWTIFSYGSREKYSTICHTEIMLAAWGDFRSNLIHHDIVSALIGVRTEHSDVTSLSPLLEGLFNRWLELGRRPYELGAGETGFCSRACSSMSAGHRVARDAIHDLIRNKRQTRAARLSLRDFWLREKIRHFLVQCLQYSPSLS